MNNVTFNTSRIMCMDFIRFYIVGTFKYTIFDPTHA